MSTQKLDDSEVEQLLRSGWSQMDVVRAYRAKGIDVTQSAISQAITTGRVKVDMGRSTEWGAVDPQTRTPPPSRAAHAALTSTPRQRATHRGNHGHPSGAVAGRVRS